MVSFFIKIVMPLSRKTIGNHATKLTRTEGYMKCWGVAASIFNINI